MNSKYYNHNASEFFSATVHVDVTPLYEQFTPHLPINGKLIDAGCGSGRDTAYFLAKGYSVTAFDASQELAKLASEYTQHTIGCYTFQDFVAQKDHYDGIWACASLLHVPKHELHDTLAHLTQFLKVDGIFYCSFKYGEDEVERSGRRFTNLNESLMEALLESLPLRIQKSWITEDLRPGRENEQWLNALLVKTAQP
ncbi:methyltransferase domain-containing protein [Vibrio sp. S4M6]|uniref:class I SAM-dependent methyltransferase n=1 Tax=Vibrio sinus TaxID=2946865 RepID=UPI002029BC54|nr:class I SAM-dependent methyltransferase [Vibrio sinus]MCL9779896.1 methyltransferase domain-containing protein [Vibrio sinus]